LKLNLNIEQFSYENCTFKGITVLFQGVLILGVPNEMSQRLPSSGIQSHVNWQKFTNVSEERSASIFRGKE
jgi:hypothetical protein